jgi:hypothetical protein
VLESRHAQAEEMMTFRNLPDLQAHLDHLRTGEHIHMPAADYQRLFGDDDASRARLDHFATGHRCVAYWSPSGIVLRRLAETIVDARTTQERRGSSIEGL